MKLEGVALGLSILLVSSLAHAQAWTRDQGSAYVNLKLSYQNGEEFFGPDFEKIPIASPYSQTSVSLYSELGLVDRWLTASFEGELFRRNAIEDLGATQGLGDLRMGLWSGVIVAPFRLSLGMKLGIPTGDPSPSAGPGADSDAQSAAAVLPTGDGEWDVEPGLAFGYGFGGRGSAWPLEHYLTVGLGYWIRTQGFSHSITYRAELGTKIPVVVLDRIWWVVKTTGIESFASTEDITTGGNIAGLGNGVSYTSLGFELNADIWQGLGLSVGWETAFRARQIISGAPLRLALTYTY